MASKHRSRLERRVFRARKIRCRKRIAESISRFDWLLERGRFANSLWYKPRPNSNIWFKLPSRAELRNDERFNNEIKEYYYENISESEEV